MEDVPLAWQIYLPDEAWEASEEARTLVIRLKSYMRHNFFEKYVCERTFSATFALNELAPALSLGELQTRLIERPEFTISCCGISLCEVYYAPSTDISKFRSFSIRKISVHITNAMPLVPLKDLKAHLVGQLVSVQGTIVRASAVRPLASQIAFQCIKCMQHTIVRLKDGVFRYGTKCIACAANSNQKTLVPDFSHLDTKCQDWQRIKIQESDTEARVPRMMEAELSGSLIDVALPGEVVTLTAILKTLPSVDSIAPTDATMYLDVISVVKFRRCESISPSQVLEVARGKAHILPRLVASFCPRIYGHEMVKLGILLCLFGGTSSEPLVSCSNGNQSNSSLAINNSRNTSINNSLGSPSGSTSIRPDAHILIVGDPGLGKSQLLSFASSVAPRAVAVCANTSSSVGLTASVQDGGLEAGALVLADRGVCCIDELDKIGLDSARALLAVMEQQRVSIAKAGVVCSLPARAAVLAAANPIGGHYERKKSLQANLNMDSALLSRFDLLFVLLDRPDTNMDLMLSSHVLSNLGSTSVAEGHSRPLQPSFSTQLSTAQNVVPNSSGQNGITYDTPLKIRLSNHVLKTFEPLDPSVLRQYISHARERTNPRLTEEAAEKLQTFYLSLRKAARTPNAMGICPDVIPVTTRHLESFVRLAEARAKMELRPFVTANDAQDIIDLVQFCTSSIYEKSTRENPSMAHVDRRGKQSKMGAIKCYVNELIKISAHTSQINFTVENLRQLYTALSVTVVPFQELLDILNQNGYILRKRSDLYQLIVT